MSRHLKPALLFVSALLSCRGLTEQFGLEECADDAPPVACSEEGLLTICSIGSPVASIDCTKAGLFCNVALGKCDPCGNLIVDSDLGEQCDDGNANDNDGCSSACQLEAICGDGSVDLGEVCDDGNTESGDGCRLDCLGIEECGDGLTDINEACDDGDNIPGDGCRADCSIEICGDSIADQGEQCDDGNPIEGDGCDSNCTATACQNEVASPTEFCLIGVAVTTFSSDGADPNALAAADFDQDQDLDLAVTNQTSNSLVVLQNNASTFSAVANITLENNGVPLDVVAGDFNGGRPDIAVLDQKDKVSLIFTNNQAGNLAFTPQPFVGTACCTQKGIAVGNLVGSNALDLATVSADDDVSILENTVSGAFVLDSSFNLSSAEPQAIVAADLNGDSLNDIAVATNDAVLIHRNAGNNTFPFFTFFLASNGPIRMTSGDVDGDTDNDLVLLTNGNGGLAIATNAGNGVFTVTVIGGNAVGQNPRGIALADMDNDLDLDIIASGQDNNRVVVFLNNDAIFTALPPFPTDAGSKPLGVVVADFNKDGAKDIATALSATGQVGVFFSRP